MINGAIIPASSKKASFTNQAGTFDATEILRSKYSTFDTGTVSTAKVKSQILKLSDFTDNWDGRGSVRPNLEAIRRAISVLEDSHTVIRNMNAVWLDPHISASEDGDVLLEWWSSNRKLSIYVDENEAEFIKVWGTNINSEMEDGLLTTGKFFDLWTWLQG